MERRLGNGMQHTKHRMQDASIAKELELSIENRLVIVIESNDHATPHIHPSVLNAMDFLDQGARVANVLNLFGLS